MPVLRLDGRKPNINWPLKRRKGFGRPCDALDLEVKVQDPSRLKTRNKLKIQEVICLPEETYILKDNRSKPEDFCLGCKLSKSNNKHKPDNL